MSAPIELPPYALLARLDVADFDRWKAGFDDNEATRREAGLLGHHINRLRDAPNTVMIYMAVRDLDGARAFTVSDDLKRIMREVGVQGPPDFSWMKPRVEQIVWDREVPAMIISHTVEDFDAWMREYTSTDELRTSNGIVGHAANQSLDDPGLVIVYHQADSFDALEAFLDNPELADAMKRAGVTSEPEVTYATGGWGKFYE